MVVKFNQYFDVIPGKQAELALFLGKTFIPRVNEIGLLNIVGAWNILVGEGPYFGLECVARSIDDIESTLLTDEYKNLKTSLLAYATNYFTKLLIPRENIFPSPTITEKGYKFVQHFNINPPDYYGFLDFIQGEYLPDMKTLQMAFTGSWYVSVGPAPHRIFEWHAGELQTVAKLFDSIVFQNSLNRLVTMTSEYSCKLLKPVSTKL